jgi:hypothetical protein
MTTTHNSWAWTPPSLPTTLSARIATIVLGLVNSALKRNVPGGLPYAMIMVIVMRIGDLGREIRALVEALQAGKRWARRTPAARLARAKAEPEVVAAPVWRLPRRFAWALGLVPDAACFGEGLRQVVAEPEMLTLMAASPLLVRRLRSLCWMLGVEMPKLPAPAPAAALEEGCVTVAVDAPEGAEAPGCAGSAASGTVAAGEVARFAAGDKRFRK